MLRMRPLFRDELQRWGVSSQMIDEIGAKVGDTVIQQILESARVARGACPPASISGEELVKAILERRPFPNPSAS